MQRVPFGLTPIALGLALRPPRVFSRACVLSADHGVGLKNSLSSGFSSVRMNRSEPAMRLVERRVLERVRGSAAAAAASQAASPAARRICSSSAGFTCRGSRIASSRRAASS